MNVLEKEIKMCLISAFGLLPCNLQWQVGSVEYLFDMKHVGDDPSVLGEGAQRQSVFSDERNGGVGQTFLLCSPGYSLP